MESLNNNFLTKMVIVKSILKGNIYFVNELNSNRIIYIVDNLNTNQGIFAFWQNLIQNKLNSGW